MSLNPTLRFPVGRVHHDVADLDRPVRRRRQDRMLRHIGGNSIVATVQVVKDKPIAAGRSAKRPRRLNRRPQTPGLFVQAVDGRLVIGEPPAVLIEFPGLGQIGDLELGAA